MYYSKEYQTVFRTSGSAGLGWEPAEAAGINNVLSKATGVDIAPWEPAPAEPAVTTAVRRYDEAYREPAPTEPEKTTVRSNFYHVLSLTIQL